MKTELNVANSLVLNRLAGRSKNNNEIVPGFNKKNNGISLRHINTQTITKTNKQIKDNSNKNIRKIKHPAYSHWFIINHVILPVNIRDQMMRNLPP
ncbi:hypothetical protein ACNPGQ_14230 [Salmonella enterica subsp. enterica serovar Give]|uniref:hypothetical protein n=1 Tax=Salmonella enterica TaxID=28901 RepID=UPI003AAE1BFB